MGEEHAPGSGPRGNRRSFDPSYCPSCGYELLPPGEFCSHCGTEIPEAGNTTDASTSDGSTDGTSTGDPPADGTSTGDSPADHETDEPSRESATTASSDERADDPEPSESTDSPDRNRSDDSEERADETPRADHADETRDAFRQRVSDWIDRGWSIERDYGDSVVLIKRDLGNAWVHLGLLVTTVWFTTGLVNAGYALWSYIGTPDRMTLHRNAEGATIDGLLEDDRTVRDADRDGDEDGDRLPAEDGAASVDQVPPTGPGRLATERPADGDEVGPRSDPDRTLESVDRKVGVTLVLIAAGIVALGGINPGSVLIASLVLLAAGSCFPSIRRNVRPTHPVTTFGPTKSTEKRPVENAGRPCTVCGDPVDRGIERTYREEVVAAGIDLYTREEGRNYYCEDCSRGETASVDPTPDPASTLEADDEKRDRELSTETASE
jgi:hypothetical protein